MSEKRSVELRCSCVEVRNMAQLLGNTRHLPPNKYTNRQSDEHHWRISLPQHLRIRILLVETFATSHA
jgi:hypothetical protein